MPLDQVLGNSDFMIGCCPVFEAGGLFEVTGLGSWLSALTGPGIYDGQWEMTKVARGFVIDVEPLSASVV